MIKTLILALCFLASGKAIADDWSTQDKVLFGLDSGLLIADWAQTRYIARNNQAYEGNPIILRNQNSSGINGYFATALIANYAITNLLHGDWRTAYQASLLVIEVKYVSGNAFVGMKMRF